MRNDRKRRISPGDIIITAVLLAAALLLMLIPRGKACTAEIICSGETVYTIELSSVKEPYKLDLENGVTVLVERSAISFFCSDCENGLCVNTGRLTRAGDTAVCIPNETIIKVRGEGSFNAITGKISTYHEA